jgi:hypothetical protein
LIPSDAASDVAAGALNVGLDAGLAFATATVSGCTFRLGGLMKLSPAADAAAGRNSATVVDNLIFERANTAGR